MLSNAVTVEATAGAATPAAAGSPANLYEGAQAPGINMIGGGTGNHYDAGQEFTLGATGDLSSVGIWAVNGAAANTYTISVYGQNPAHGSLGNLVETLTGSSPANAGNGSGPYYDFVTLTGTSPALVQSGSTYWFVLTSTVDGYWGLMNGTTATTKTVGGTTLNGMFTTSAGAPASLTTPGGTVVTYLNTPATPVPNGDQLSLLVKVAPVPAPAALPLLLSGLASLGLMARRRRLICRP